MSYPKKKIQLLLYTLYKRLIYLVIIISLLSYMQTLISTKYKKNFNVTIHVVYIPCMYMYNTQLKSYI